VLGTVIGEGETAPTTLFRGTTAGVVKGARKRRTQMLRRRLGPIFKGGGRTGRRLKTKGREGGTTVSVGRVRRVNTGESSI